MILPTTKPFQSAEEMLRNKNMRTDNQPGLIENIFEALMFPFTWMAIRFNKKETMQSQLMREICEQEHSRLSNMRHMAMMKADAAKSEILRDELSVIYEETLRTEARMKMVQEQLQRGVPYATIMQSLGPVKYGEGRFDPAAR